MEDSSSIPKKILVCDNENDMLDIIRLIFSKRGYEVLVSLDCESLLDKIKSNKPHLILLDLNVPKIGGAETARILKRDSATRDIPLVLMSGENEIAKIARDVRANAYVSKPFLMKDLVTKVQNLIHSR